MGEGLGDILEPSCSSERESLDRTLQPVEKSRISTIPGKEVLRTAKLYQRQLPHTSRWPRSRPVLKSHSCQTIFIQTLVTVRDF